MVLSGADCCRATFAVCLRSAPNQTAREQRAGCDLNHMCLLFPSPPTGFPPRLTHRWRSGPARFPCSGQGHLRPTGLRPLSIPPSRLRRTRNRNRIERDPRRCGSRSFDRFKEAPMAQFAERHYKPKNANPAESVSCSLWGATRERFTSGTAPLLD
jgi:hypothetical protein